MQATAIAVGEILRRRKLVHRRLSQRNAHRVPDSVGEQGRNPDKGLDSPRIPVPGLGHSQMKRVVHILRNHPFHQKSVSLDHNNRVACLEADHHSVEIIVPAHPQPLHRRLLHREGRVAVERGNPLPERAMVHSDSDSRPVLLADRDQTRELLPRLVMVPVEISGVDADLLHDGGSRNGYFGTEMHVGDNRGLNPGRPQTRVNLRQGIDLRDGRNRQANHLRPGLRQFDTLSERRLHIRCVGVAHGLHHNRGSASNRNIANFYGSAYIFHIFEFLMLLIIDKRPCLLAELPAGLADTPSELEMQPDGDYDVLLIGVPVIV